MLNQTRGDDAMKYKNVNLCPVLFFIQFLFIFSGYANNSDFNFNYLNTKNGLSNNFVTNVFQDSRGFIWIATADGLNRYNGIKCELFKFNYQDKNSLPNNFIQCVAEDHSGNIWIGTNQSGVTRYNISEEKFYRYRFAQNNDSSVSGGSVRDIYVDANNSVWIGTDFGLDKYESKTGLFKHVPMPVKITSRSVDISKIIPQPNNKIIVYCNYGLYKININDNSICKIELQIPEIENELTGKAAPPILLDRKDNIWIGIKEGLLKHNLRTKKSRMYIHSQLDEKSISSYNVSVIYEDSQGNIWIGTQNSGINLYNEQSDNFIRIKASIYKSNSLSNNIITNIYEDRNSNLWFSTQEGGINILNISQNQFEHFYNNPDNPNSVSDNKISTIYQDSKGTIWIGTGNGILNKLHDNNSFIKYPLKNDNIARSILGITEGKANTLYITGWGIGLYEFNPATAIFTDLLYNVKIKGSIPSRNIKGLGVDDKGNIWLATHNQNGLLVYSPTDKRFYNAEDPGPFNKELLKVPYAATLLCDSRKRIWVISYTGLYMFDGVLHKYDCIPEESHTISSNYIFTLFEDRNKQLWVGSSNGLDRIIESKGKISFERMSYKYSIPNNVKGILQDKNGYLWISSNLELTQFHPESKKIKHYKINKELPSQEFFENSRLKARNGEMYFGGTSGFFRFQPDSVNTKNYIPKVYIENFLLFNKPQKANSSNSVLKKSILETKEVELKHNQSVISIEYIALNYNQYRTIEYAYKMEGFDKEWYIVGEKRSVTYTNLPPGYYTFKVTTVDGNTPLEKYATELKIRIHPPFWKTWWAYILYIILFLSLLYLFRRNIVNREKLKNELKLEKIKIQNIREKDMMKLRFFTNISHEFRTPLTLIKAPLEKLYGAYKEVGKEEYNYYLSLIQKNSEKLLSMVNQLMDYRKLEAGSLQLESSNGDIIAFCRNIWSGFSFLAKQKNIEYTFQSKIDSLVMSFDADKMEKVISNLLSNAFKFTPNYGRISLSINFFGIERSSEIENSENLQICIKDNGIGISEKDLPYIFERFYSVSKTDAGKIEGTGLGLTLAKELTELHKGSLTVKSKEGEGAEFTILIPVITYKSKVKKQTESEDTSKTEIINSEVDFVLNENADNKKHKILLVEDDDELRNFINNELKSDYSVLLAKNGDEGLRIAFFEIPDLILSDVMMPKMDGFNFCRMIKADERTSHLPVILLTAHHTQEKQLEGFDAGADDYILKPFNSQILKIRIRNLLNTRKDIIDKFKQGTSLYFNDDRVENKDRKLLQSFIDLILENISNENLNADFIANKMNMSRSLVYIKIEAISGQTVNEFIRNIRLKKSTHLLTQSNLTITEIAYEVGFSSQSYFTRSFTKLYGLSPKDYINKNKHF